MKLAFLLLFFFQSDPIPDLKSQLPIANDTTKVLLMADLCYEYRFVNQDSALYYGEQAIVLAKKVGFKRGHASALSDLGVVYLDQSNFEKALGLWKESLIIRKEIKDLKGVAALYLKMGTVEFHNGNMDNASGRFLDALQIFEQIGNGEGTLHALNNVGAIYEHQNRLDKALEYYLRSSRLAGKINSQQDVGVAAINIANIYYQQNKIDSAVYFGSQAVKILEGNVRATGYYGMALNNLSDYYIQKQYFDSARVAIRKALRIREEIQDSVGIVSSLNNRGVVYLHDKQYDSAVADLTLALSIAIPKNLKVEQKKIYNNLSALYFESGNAGLAFDSYKKYVEVNEELRNNEQAKQIAEINLKYETDKKEQQIDLQEAAIHQQESEIKFTYTVIVTLVAIVILIVIIFLLVRNRARRKQQLIEKEHDLFVKEAFIRASIQSQEKERRRFAQDLHDGMGQLISSIGLLLSDINSDSSLETRVSIVSKSEKIIEEMQNEIRGIAFNLMPQTLIQLGLPAALKEMSVRVSASGKIVITEQAFEMPQRLMEVQEISLYRIIQEWVNNIMKYADATRIEIQLVGHEEELTITIEDNGNGFDPAVLEQGAGNGWKNIASRLHLIHGSVDIDSSPGRRGTTLLMKVPLEIEHPELFLTTDANTQ